MAQLPVPVEVDRDADYAATIAKYPNPQAAAEAFTQLALDRGTKDNVTCLVIAFD